MTKAEILKQLFDKDVVHKELDLGEGTPKIIISSISYEKQINLEERLRALNDEKKLKRQFLQEYAIELLSHTLVGWGVMRDARQQEWMDFLKNKSVGLLDKIVKEQQKLEQQIRDALNDEDVGETFFPKDELLDESTPSSQESTQESEAASEKQ